jgi:hypothetical protein
MPVGLFRMKSLKEGAMWRIDLLLGKGLKTNNETTAAAMHMSLACLVYKGHTPN